jgi:hypothetical protein
MSHQRTRGGGGTQRMRDRGRLTVSLTPPGDAAGLCFEVDAADRIVEIGDAPFLDP